MTTPGTNIAIDKPTAAANQQFRFVPVGKVLLASPTNARKTLGVTGCRSSSHVGGAKARFERRASRSCQQWRVKPVHGADVASYRVTNASSGKRLATSGQGLRVVKPGDGAAARRTWTLTPTNDGTWTLTSGSTRVAVKLLIP